MDQPAPLKTYIIYARSDEAYKLHLLLHLRPLLKSRLLNVWHDGNILHPVATKKANELGLYDMSGNVEEWYADYYGRYPNCNEPKQDSKSRIARGGSLLNRDINCRTTDCLSTGPNYKGNNIGFRLAQD